ncbi:peptidyl-prolyl cis-trans isomerase D [Nicoletella semolina]|uniref:Periplasmic chaperone PpiD n=1 Tax=Nicoletella semolina TaxID=271160 RepID=A0A4R2N6Q7_9PAST|nr:SurA N-terminal domain-containing protein [Nicoletella semolina]MDH2925181.1 peptidylprolyl isomerase [Nicoletella semolina]TCP16508.1 peptidyl-prolyl cis-trans isomerase D [Nicoletella semolina]
MIEKMHEKTNSLWFKVIFGLIAVTFVLGGIGGTLIATDTSAVKVNGEEISQHAFNNAKNNEQNLRIQQLGERYWDLMETPEYSRTFHQDVLNQLVNEELLRQYAAELKLGISADQIKSEIVNLDIFQKDGKFDNHLYQQLLRNNGLSADQYAAIINQDMLFSQLQEGVISSNFIVPAQQELLAKLLLQKRQVRLSTLSLEQEITQQNVTDNELVAHFDQHQNNFVKPETLTAEFVSITPKDIEKNIKVTDEQIEHYYQTNLSQYVTKAEKQIAHIQVETADQAVEIAKEIANGGDFAQLAQQKSLDKLSAANGGDLGWVTTGIFPKAFEEAAHTLNVGEVSNPVEVEGKYHIIKVLAEKKPTQIPLEQVKAQITDTLRSELVLTEYSRITREMANHAFESNGSLAEVAKVANLTVQNTESFTQENVPAPLNHEKVIKALFSDELRQNGQNSEALEVGDSLSPHTLFVRVSKYEPQRLYTFEEAKEAVTRSLKQERAENALKIKAENQLKALQEGKLDTVTFDKSEEFAFIQHQDPVLSNTIFAMPKPSNDNPVQPTYRIGKNLAGDTVIIALDKVTDGDITQFKAMIPQLEQANQLSMLQSLTQALRERASIEINEQFIEDVINQAQ